MVSRWVSGLIVLAVSGSPLAAQTLADPPSPAQTAHLENPAPAPTSAADKPSVPPSNFEIAARAAGTPDIPGLNIVWLVPWGRLELARDWQNIVVHQSEGPPGSARRNALAQAEKPDRRGATIWVETDGTVYWSTVEFAVPHHVRDGNRNDNRYIDNGRTHGQVTDDNSIGIEFVGNYPNVRKPPTDAQIAAWRILVRVLQARYNIPSERVYAHNWIDYKDNRYCEGCSLASAAREQPMLAVAQPHRAE